MTNDVLSFMTFPHIVTQSCQCQIQDNERTKKCDSLFSRRVCMHHLNEWKKERNLLLMSQLVICQ